MTNKKAYFQGGGGVNEPEPKRKKYPVEPAIVVQPRFKEPFYRNYDLYDTEGVSGPAQHGPGSGWSHMDEHKSVQEFLEFRRQRLKGKYVADDSYIEDTPANYKERVDKMKIRASLFDRIIKRAAKECKDSDIEYTDRRDAYICRKCLHMTQNCKVDPKPTAKELHAGKNYNTHHIDYRNDAPQVDGKSQPRVDENDGPNFDYGKGLYSNMDKYKSVEDFEEHADKGPGAFFADDNDLGTGFYENLEHYKSVRDFIEHTPLGRNHGAKIKPEWERAKDVNHIDFPVDDEVNHDSLIRPEEGQYQPPRLVGPSGTDDRTVQPSDTGYDSIQLEFTTPQIAGEHSYTPLPDFDGRGDNGSSLDFGRDYDDEAAPVGRTWDENMVDDENFDIDSLLDILEAKYLDENDSDMMLQPAETEIYGLPDGVQPDAKDADQTIQNLNPWDTKSDISREMYEDKWNI
jgi:hypothetical protein